MLILSPIFAPDYQRWYTEYPLGSHIDYCKYISASVFSHKERKNWKPLLSHTSSYLKYHETGGTVLFMNWATLFSKIQVSLDIFNNMAESVFQYYWFVFCQSHLCVNFSFSLSYEKSFFIWTLRIIFVHKVDDLRFRSICLYNEPSSMPL